MKDQAALDKLTATLGNYLAAQSDVVAGYIFGSTVQRRAAPGRDVDVAVLLREDLDDETRFRRRLRLGTEMEDIIGARTDLVVLNDAPPVLQYQVLRHGRLVFERNRSARVEFEVRVGKVYADLKPMYDFFARALFREIKEVGLGGRRRRRARTLEASAG